MSILWRRAAPVTVVRAGKYQNKGVALQKNAFIFRRKFWSKLRKYVPFSQRNEVVEVPLEEMGLSNKDIEKVRIMARTTSTIGVSPSMDPYTVNRAIELRYKKMHRRIRSASIGMLVGVSLFSMLLIMYHFDLREYHDMMQQQQQKEADEEEEEEEAESLEVKAETIIRSERVEGMSAVAMVVSAAAAALSDGIKTLILELLKFVVSYSDYDDNYSSSNTDNCRRSINNPVVIVFKPRSESSSRSNCDDDKDVIRMERLRQRKRAVGGGGREEIKDKEVKSSITTAAAAAETGEEQVELFSRSNGPLTSLYLRYLIPSRQLSQAWFFVTSLYIPVWIRSPLYRILTEPGLLSPHSPKTQLTTEKELQTEEASNTAGKGNKKRNISTSDTKGVMTKIQQQQQQGIEDLERPLSHYETIQQFLERRIAASARPIDATASLVAPCDGVITAQGSVSLFRKIVEANEDVDTFNNDRESTKKMKIKREASGHHLLTIKGWSLDIRSLTGGYPGSIPGGKDEKESSLDSSSKKILHYVVVNIPFGWNHHFHSPCDISLHKRLHTPGYLHPFHSIINPLNVAFNERISMIGEWAGGFCTLVAVGSIGRGSIHLKFEPEVETNIVGQSPGVNTRYPYRLSTYGYFRQYQPSLQYSRGSELGHFKAGSSIVLIFETTHLLPNESYKSNNIIWCKKLGDRIKQGEALVKITSDL